MCYHGPHDELWNIAGGPQKLINFILKLYFYLTKENKDFSWLTSYVSNCHGFRFDAMLCSSLVNENSYAGHIKCSWGHIWPASRRFPAPAV